MRRTLAAPLIASLALCAGAPALASPSSHDSHARGAQAVPARLSLDQGRPWATDEPLRRHMDALRASLHEHRDPILRNALDDAEARALGVAIERRVAAIVAECRLESRADANLHVIVADLSEAADILQGRSRLHPRRGAPRAIRAVQMYATYFDHPGWIPVL